MIQAIFTALVLMFKMVKIEHSYMIHSNRSQNFWI